MGKAAVLVASLQQLAPGGVETFMVLRQHGPMALPHLSASSVTVRSCRAIGDQLHQSRRGMSMSMQRLHDL